MHFEIQLLLFISNDCLFALQVCECECLTLLWKCWAASSTLSESYWTTRKTEDRTGERNYDNMDLMRWNKVKVWRPDSRNKWVRLIEEITVCIEYPVKGMDVRWWREKWGAGDAIMKIICYLDSALVTEAGQEVAFIAVFFFFSPPAVWAELTAPNKTHHPVPGANLIGKSLIRSDGFCLQTRTVKPHTLEDSHPQHQPTGRKRCITQSMQLHLTDAIHNADIEHYRSTFICHNPTVWITCQHNMYVVPV